MQDLTPNRLIKATQQGKTAEEIVISGKSSAEILKDMDRTIDELEKRLLA